MQITEISYDSLEKIREYTEYSKRNKGLNLKNIYDLLTLESLKKAIDEKRLTFKNIIAIQTNDSKFLLQIIAGKYFNYYTDAEIMFDKAVLKKIFIVSDFSKEDINALQQKLS